MSRSNHQIAAAELNRFDFYVKRDGIAAAIAFAKQCMKQYRAALGERNSGGFRTGYGLAYHRELTISAPRRQQTRR